MKGAVSFQPLAKNLFDHIGGKRVDLQFLVLMSSFDITVYGESAHIIAIFPFGLQGAAGFNGYIPAIRLVHDVFHGNGQIVPVFLEGVEVIVDGDEPDIVRREEPANVPARFNRFASQAGQVFYDDTVGFATLDHLDHFRKRGTVKQDAAVSVVDFFGNRFDLRVFGDEIVDHPALVAHAVALHGFVLRVGEPNVLDCLVNFHAIGAPFLRIVRAAKGAVVCSIPFPAPMITAYFIMCKDADSA